MHHLNKLFILLIGIITISSCATSRAVVSNSVDISRYDYVTFGDGTTFSLNIGMEVIRILP